MAQYRQPIQYAKYISQYDPLHNQRIEKDLELRDKNFKTAYSAMAEAQAKQGDIFFVDQENKKRLAENLDKRKNNILEKYNWEYDKAAPELANLIVEERNNPLYNLNKLQQQRLAEQDKLKSQYGNDAIVHRSVPLTLTDKEGNPLSPEDFGYDIEKRDDYDKIIKNGAIGIINSGEQTGLIGSDKAQYLKSKYTQGLDNLSPRELEDFKESMGDILDKTTTLTRDPNFGNIQNDDGTYKRTYTGYNFINDNLHRLIPGSTKYNFVRNANYISPKDGENPSPNDNTIITAREKVIGDIPKNEVLNNYKKIRDRYNQLLEDEQRHNAKFTDNSLTTVIATNIPEQVNSTTKDNEKVEIKKLYDKHRANYINKYKNVYNYFHDKGISDNEIFNKIEKAEQNYQFNNDYILNSEQAAPTLYKKALSATNAKIYDIDNKGIIDTKPTNKNDLLSRTNVGSIQSAVIDPKNEAVILTFDDATKGKSQYAIKTNSNVLGRPGNIYLKAISKLNNKLNDITDMTVNIPVDENGKIGFKIIRDENSLEPIIKYFNKDSKKFKTPVRVNTTDAFSLLSKLFLKSQSIENKAKPNYYHN